MNAIRVTFTAALVVAALAAAGCGGGDEGAGETTMTETTTTETTSSGGTALVGSVGPGFDISLTNQDGSPVETLAPGSYTVEVDDKATSHNFHLSGPGVDVSTDVGAEGSETFQVELQAGSYSFVCDPHESSMNGSFEVSG